MSANMVILKDAKEDVDKVCIEVQITSDNVGEKPTRGLSLQHKTFSALNYVVRWLKAQIYTERTKAPNFAWL